MIEATLIQKFVGPLQPAGAVSELRKRILLLAVVPIVAALGFAVQSAFIYLASMWGLFIPLLRQGFGAEPADWVLWIGDPAIAQILFFVGLGLLGGLIFRKWPVVSTLALVLFFPGFLSLKAFVGLFLAERLGDRLWSSRKSVASTYRWAMLSTVVVLLLWVWLGHILQFWVSGMLQMESIFHPASRMMVTLLVISLGLCLEIMINLIVLHFHYLKLLKA